MRLIVVGLIVCLSLSVLPHTAGAKEITNINKKQAISLALAEYTGKTLKVTENKDFYIVRILQKDGRIIDLKVDKKTGKVKKD
jgi:uncharacterized membrane protein YkoI